jgi:ethanolamine utilization protein EutQ (cupin superfamily)
MTDEHAVMLKRQVTLKTRVTDAFRERAKKELGDEVQLIEAQTQQLEKIAAQGQNVQKQLAQLNQEAQQRRSQLASLKMQLSTQLANLDRAQNGDCVITGILDNFVEVRVGDNIYEKLNNAEMIIEDGIVRELRLGGEQGN